MVLVWPRACFDKAMDTLAITSAPQRSHLDQAQSEPSQRGERTPLFGEDGFTFGDVLDMVNPLQHIPVLNGLYRRLSGDEISMGSRMAGGAIFGGPVGFAAAMVNSMVEDTTGRDVGEHMLAVFWPEQGQGPGEGQRQDAPTLDIPRADPARQMAAAPQTVPANEVDLATVLFSMTASQSGSPRAADPTIAQVSNEPAFLAAMPPRARAAASREAAMDMHTTALGTPSPATSTDVPTLSPAAMNALIASLASGNMDEGEEHEADDGSAGLTQEPSLDPASMAAWQAAMATRMTPPVATAP